MTGEVNVNIIAIETSGRIGSVAVCKDRELLAERSFEKGMRHGRELLPSLKTIFEELGWQPADTDLIAVSIGPGSYTGLRVGLTCAKTLANLLRAQVIGVPSLDVLAANVLCNTNSDTTHQACTEQSERDESHPSEAMSICPIIDAKRKEVYACIYEAPHVSAGSVTASPTVELRKTTDYLVIAPREIAKVLPSGCLIFGDGAHAYRDVFDSANVIIGDDELAIGRANVVAKLGYEAYTRGARHGAASLTPMYLRRPQAEDVWEAKHKEAN